MHVFVATGALLRFSLAEPLSAGDAMLLTDEPSYDVTAAVPTDCSSGPSRATSG